MSLENSFAAWATTIGGFTGFISAAFVAYEKFTKGAKIVCEVRNATYENGTSGNYFTVVFDIGNIGSEMTTLKKVFLEIDELSFMRQSYDIQHVGERFRIQVDDHRTHAVLPGEAFVLSFKFSRKSNEKIDEERTLKGRLKLELLNHSVISIPVQIVSSRGRKEDGSEK